MNIPFYHVDAFTDNALGGNPAAIIILKSSPKKNWMQDVAREINLSETAYLTPKEEKGFELRWFTPQSEVDLCGHATLASAHILWETERLTSNQPAVFYTKSGILTAQLVDNWIKMDFPAEIGNPLVSKESIAPVEKALDAKAKNIEVNRFDYLVEVESEKTLRSLKPNFKSIAKLPCRGLIATCLSESKDYDFLSRFFAPSIGINEDPVTGSTHCFLGPYWSAKLKKNKLIGYQASKSGGVVQTFHRTDHVILGGKAITRGKELINVKYTKHNITT
jgi:PhzF family phenazine biosynthesis protein